MKVEPGKTYVGPTGARRYVTSVTRREVVYDVPNGGERFCQRKTFDRWAQREAEPDEATQMLRGA